jgi:hypothetical protein
MTLVGERVDSTWPREVELMISALEAAHRSPRNRRKRYRTQHRTVATLRLFVDGDGRPRTVYTRNVDSRGAGFLSPERLPLGYGGTVEMLTPSGDTVIANCTIFRCSEIVNGWYEAALSFNTEQWQFDAPTQPPTLKLRRPP